MQLQAEGLCLCLFGGLFHAAGLRRNRGRSVPEWV